MNNCKLLLALPFLIFTCHAIFMCCIRLWDWAKEALNYICKTVHVGIRLHLLQLNMAFHIYQLFILSLENKMNVIMHLTIKIFCFLIIIFVYRNTFLCRGDIRKEDKKNVCSRYIIILFCVV